MMAKSGRGKETLTRLSVSGTRRSSGQGSGDAMIHTEPVPLTLVHAVPHVRDTKRQRGPLHGFKGPQGEVHVSVGNWCAPLRYRHHCLLKKPKKPTEERYSTVSASQFQKTAARQGNRPCSPGERQTVKARISRKTRPSRSARSTNHVRSSTRHGQQGKVSCSKHHSKP